MFALRPKHRLGIAGITMTAMLATPATTIASDEVDQLQHYADCFKWLLTDLAMHELNCTPARPFDFPDQPGVGGGIQFILGAITSDKAWTDGGEGPTGEPCPTSEPCGPTGQECPTPEPCGPTGTPI